MRKIIAVIPRDSEGNLVRNDEYYLVDGQRYDGFHQAIIAAGGDPDEIDSVDETIEAD